MGHCILLISVILITLVAFSSGKQIYISDDWIHYTEYGALVQLQAKQIPYIHFFNGLLRTNRNLQQISACIQEILWKHGTIAPISVPLGKTSSILNGWLKLWASLIVNRNVQKLTVTFHESLIEHKLEFNNANLLASLKWSLFWHKREFLINIHLI